MGMPGKPASARCWPKSVGYLRGDQPRKTSRQTEQSCQHAFIRPPDAQPSAHRLIPQGWQHNKQNKGVTIRSPRRKGDSRICAVASTPTSLKSAHARHWLCAWERWKGWRGLFRHWGWIFRALSAWPSWVKSKKFRSTCLPGQRAIRPTSSAERFFAASAKAHFLSQIRLDNHRLDAPCIVQSIKFEQFIARYPHP